MRHTLLILAMLLSGCTAVEPDSRPAFVLDASKPFVIEFGRGSGWHGLDVVKISKTGSVELHRTENRPNAETATLQLSAADVKKVVDQLNSCQLTSLGRSYSDPGVQDGTQWILWIQQSASEKSVYFNNAFPAPINAFAGGLDAVLQNAGLSNVSWTPIPKQQGIDQQKALWARIQPAK